MSARPTVVAICLETRDQLGKSWQLRKNVGVAHLAIAIAYVDLIQRDLMNRGVIRPIRRKATYHEREGQFYHRRSFLEGLVLATLDYLGDVPPLPKAGPKNTAFIIAAHANATGEAYAGTERIAAALHKSLRAVLGWMEELEAAGVLQVFERAAPGGRGHKYPLVAPKQENLSSPPEIISDVVTIAKQTPAATEESGRDMKQRSSRVVEKFPSRCEVAFTSRREAAFTQTISTKQF